MTGILLLFFFSLANRAIPRATSTIFLQSTKIIVWFFYMNPWLLWNWWWFKINHPRSPTISNLMLSHLGCYKLGIRFVIKWKIRPVFWYPKPQLSVIIPTSYINIFVTLHRDLRFSLPWFGEFSTVICFFLLPWFRDTVCYWSLLYNFFHWY